MGGGEVVLAGTGEAVLAGTGEVVLAGTGGLVSVAASKVGPENSEESAACFYSCNFLATAMLCSLLNTASSHFGHSQWQSCASISQLFPLLQCWIFYFFCHDFLDMAGEVFPSPIVLMGDVFLEAPCVFWGVSSISLDTLGCPNASLCWPVTCFC